MKSEREQVLEQMLRRILFPNGNSVTVDEVNEMKDLLSCQAGDEYVDYLRKCAAATTFWPKWKQDIINRNPL